MRRMTRWAAVAAAAWCAAAQADVRVPAIFGSHMLLQAGTNTPVWGWADPGENVAVTVGEARAAATAGADGKWHLILPELKAATNAVTVTVAGKNTLTFEDVLIGEVWLCSGQSNMGMPMRSVVGRDTSNPMGLGQANNPQLRLFKMPVDGFHEPMSDCRGKWSVCTPDEAREFSAAGYFFGRDLNQALRVPVGLINASRGGSSAQRWVSLEGLRSEPALSNYLAQALAGSTDYAARKERFIQDRAKWKAAADLRKQWEAEAAKSRAEGREPPAEPAQPGEAPVPPVGLDTRNENDVDMPAMMFNSMIAPVIPFGIRGVIWYQGEANTGEAALYGRLFETLIRDWRGRWGRGDFPFYFVQLPNFGKAREQPGESNWAALREAQFLTLKKAPNTAMAVTIDIGDPNNIHPKNKAEVGRRLALLALARAYGREQPHSGPLYEGMAVEGGRVRVRFAHADGLAAKGGEPLKRFAVAGADRRFAWAEARVDGGAVVVACTNVPSPVAVRYAWEMNPEGCNLVNAAGLPASPFRTDDWPLTRDSE